MTMTFLHDLKANAKVDYSHAPGSTISGTAEDVGAYVQVNDTVGQVAALVANGTVDESAVTAQAHTCKLKEADDSGGTGEQDVPGTETVTLDGDSQTKVVTAHNRSKEYVAVSVTPDFTDGSAPSTEFASFIIMQKERF